MGKATILSHLGEAQYSIQVDYGHDRMTALLAPLAARVTALDIKIAQGTVALAAARLATALAVETSHIAITALADAQQADPNTSHNDLLVACVAAQEDVIRKRGAEDRVAILLALDKAERAQLQRRIAALQEVPLFETRTAWCATRTEGVSGSVATAEIPGEAQTMLIAPDAPAWDASAGALLARQVMSPEQAFWNAAVLPGWQKWRPRYRKGTISSVDKTLNTASVDLDAAVSTANSLGVDQSTSLSNIPVIYMTCNAAVFEVGDRCLVLFPYDAWSDARIVGFVDHPKSCAYYDVAYVISITATPSTGCIFGLGIVFSDTMSNAPQTQNILTGHDCEPVSLLNTSADGNRFLGWSDGNSSASRHDLDITEDATYTASAILVPIRVGVTLGTGTFLPPPYTYTWYYAQVNNPLLPGDYEILSWPATRYFSTEFGVYPPDGFFDFNGASLSISALGETMSYVISQTPTTAAGVLTATLV